MNVGQMSLVASKTSQPSLWGSAGTALCKDPGFGTEGPPRGRCRGYFVHGFGASCGIVPRPRSVLMTPAETAYFVSAQVAKLLVAALGGAAFLRICICIF